MKKNNIWELILKVIVAAITAALTAITTTSCMGELGLFRVVTAPPASEHLLERKNVTTVQQRGESPHSRRRTGPFPLPTISQKA